LWDYEREVVDQREDDIYFMRETFIAIGQERAAIVVGEAVAAEFNR
jgi:hypothetical protein